MGFIQFRWKPAVEIDISASHLSIMHALMGLPLPKGDPYVVPGFDRSTVKAWINATLDPV